MSNEEKGPAPGEDADEEEEEVVTTCLLLDLNDKFDRFAADVLGKLDGIMELKTVVAQLCESRCRQRASEAARKRDQRARDKEERERDRIPLQNNIFRHDTRLKLKYFYWAHIGIQFGLVGDSARFLQFVAGDWNHQTFLKKPIARISNRPNYWKGGIRHECTWCDMFGSERKVNSKTCWEIIFWDFKYHMVQVVKRMATMPDWPNVARPFKDAVRVALGDMHCVLEDEIGPLTIKGHTFEPQMPSEDLDKVPHFKILVQQVMQAYRRGISKGYDNDLEVVRIGKRCYDEHCKLLRKESNNMRFLVNLKGHAGRKLTDQERDHREHLGFLGFYEKPDIKTV